jgi:ABC-type Zn2+ transport system substrate-binding protein/surface adhesin
MNALQISEVERLHVRVAVWCALSIRQARNTNHARNRNHNHKHNHDHNHTEGSRPAHCACPRARAFGDHTQHDTVGMSI